MFPLFIPAMMLQVKTESFDFDRFRATRIHPNSNPALVASFERLYQDSPTFREQLARFAKAEPMIALWLEPMEEKSFGDLIVRKLPNGYLIGVKVQTKLVRMGLDAPDPWLGALLFLLADTCRNSRIQGNDPSNFTFTSGAELDFWTWQRDLRMELAPAAKARKSKLAPNAKYIYNHIILGKTSKFDAELGR